MVEWYDLRLRIMLRLAWIFGFVSTREYDSERRVERFGPEAADAIDGTPQHLERTLLEDRVAMILFLIGIIIFAYTFLNAPVFRAWT
jgi:hypothetical protein